jgi:hypothetical protein
MVKIWYHDTQHNNTQHNDTQRKGLIGDIALVTFRISEDQLNNDLPLC